MKFFFNRKARNVFNAIGDVREAHFEAERDAAKVLA